VTYTITAGAEIGLAAAEKVELRQLHPTERVLETCRFGGTFRITVPPFRACLLLATTAGCAEPGVSGCDYEVVRDKAEKPVSIRLLGTPGTTANVSLLPAGRRFSSASLAGRQVPQITQGQTVTVTFEGTPPAHPWHRKLATLAPADLPADAESLYEATCFAADSNALEARALARSGETTIPAVKAARDAFFQQRVFVGRGLWDHYLFDGDPATCFHVTSRRRPNPPGTAEPLVRIDFGETIRPDRIELTIPDQYSLVSLVEGEGGSVAQVSADLKTWTDIPFIHGESCEIIVPKGTVLRYLRIPKFPCRIAEANAYAGGRKLPRTQWRASNLFNAVKDMKFTKAWTGKVRVEEMVHGTYLCVALNGRHGVEGAYAALRCGNGAYIGAPDRATSYPCNPWEGASCKRDSNYTYYFPVTPEMIGKDLEVVVLGSKDAGDKLCAEVWQTAPSTPFVEKWLILE
jgi:hypothetical protein